MWYFVLQGTLLTCVIPYFQVSYSYEESTTSV